MDKKYKTELANSRIHTIIVAHDAYQHFDKYGIKTLAVKDESDSKDPTQKELNNIIESAKVRGINMFCMKKIFLVHQWTQ